MMAQKSISRDKLNIKNGTTSQLEKTVYDAQKIHCNFRKFES